MNGRIFLLAAATLSLIPGCWSRKRHAQVITEECTRGSGPEHWGDSVLQELEETDPIK